MSLLGGAHFTGDWFEQDPRWSAVDAYTLSHLHPTTRPNHGALEKALENSAANGLPRIATYPVFSKLLALQVRVGQVKHVLEVGTLGGYTPIWIASLNPDVKITSLEVDPKHAEVARENIANAGFSDRIEVILGPALETLPKLIKEIEEGKRERFGLSYIDADKVNNLPYFQLSVEAGKPGMSIFVDNVVRKGDLVREDAGEDAGVLGARRLIEAVGKDDRVDALVQQTVAEKTYDGFLFAVVK